MRRDTEAIEEPFKGISGKHVLETGPVASWRGFAGAHVQKQRHFSRSRAIGDHHLQIGSQNGPDSDIAGVVDYLCRFGLAGPHDIVETFEGDIETDVLSEPEAVDYCSSLDRKWAQAHRRPHVGVHAEGKGPWPEPHDP